MEGEREMRNEQFAESIKCKRGNHCDGRKYEITNNFPPFGGGNIEIPFDCAPAYPLRVGASSVQSLCGESERNFHFKFHSSHNCPIRTAMAPTVQWKTVNCTLIKNVLLNSFPRASKSQIIRNEKAANEEEKFP